MTNRILIQGLGRSGTTWLHKIFDQHEETLCIHEPDKYIDFKALGAIEDDDARLTRFLDQVFSSRILFSMRKRPIMTKAYRSGMEHHLRNGLMYGLSAAGAAPGMPAAKIDQISVPDLLASPPGALVAKIVNSNKHIIGLAEADPQLKIIYILRHPCGQINSYMTGLALNKMPEQFMPHAEGMRAVFPEFSANNPDQDGFTQLEILAYRWAVFNHLFCKSLEGAPNAKILRYEDLCAEPIGVSKALFDWAELSWPDRAETFLQSSIGAGESVEDYHGLTRQPIEAATKWRQEMAPADIEKVMSICRQSNAWSYYKEDPCDQK